MDRNLLNTLHAVVFPDYYKIGNNSMLTFVQVLHVVIAEIKGSETLRGMKVSSFEVTDRIMRQVDVDNVVGDT